MQRYSLTHLADATLLADGRRSARHESASTAARAAREHPALFEAIADGRLTLTTVNLLAPALTDANAAELIAAAARLTKRQVQELLAERAAKTEAAARPAVAPPAPSNGSLAPALVAPNGASEAGAPEPPAAAPAPLRYPLHALLGKAEQEDLEYLKALLGHSVPSGETTQVLGRAFKAAIRELERVKFGVTSRPRKGSPKTSVHPRHIPNPVKREVFVRDGGCCTFVSARGHRCASRMRIQFHHVISFAEGGESTVPNLYLRCRTHNQHPAEQAFGKEFMARKREESRAKTAARARAAQAAEAERARKEAYARELAANEAARAIAEESMPWLRKLGFRATEARQAAMAAAEALPQASLEDRMKHALRSLAPPSARKVLPAPPSPA